MKPQKPPPHCAVIYILYAEDGRGIRYVGWTTKTLEGRLRQHRNEHSDTRKCRWMKKVGPKNVRLVVIKHVLVSDALRIEIEYIRIFREMGFELTNSTDGGEGCPNPSPETRAKMSVAKKGKTQTPEHIANAAAARAGQHRSPEFCAYMSSIRLGKKRKPFTPEHLANMSRSHTGLKATPEHRANVSKGKMGKKHKTGLKRKRGAWPVDRYAKCGPRRKTWRKYWLYLNITLFHAGVT
jgi:hypothetical protein